MIKKCHIFANVLRKKESTCFDEKTSFYTPLTTLILFKSTNLTKLCSVSQNNQTPYLYFASQVNASWFDDVTIFALENKRIILRKIFIFCSACNTECHDYEFQTFSFNSTASIFGNKTLQDPQKPWLKWDRRTYFNTEKLTHFPFKSRFKYSRLCPEAPAHGEQLFQASLG